MIELFNSRPFQILHRVFLAGVMTYGIALMFFGVSFRVWAQIPTHDELERRVTAIEGQNLEHRVTVMETILSDLQGNILWQRLNMGGTGLLLAEVVTRSIRQKPEKAGLVTPNGG